MTDPVSATGAISSSTFVRLPNPGQEGGVSLSKAAEASLQKLGQMQNEFQDVAKATEAIKTRVLDTNPGSGLATDTSEGRHDLAHAAKEVAASIEASAQIQAQLAQFVLASSVSSSFGRNLNMFLRGQ